MKRTCWLMIMLLVALLSIGCRREAATPPPPPAETPGTIHLGRCKEAEGVFALLGRKGWAFKHLGGELTADFVIYHHPPGTNQQDKVIFKADTRQALIMRGAEVPGSTTKDDEPGGYLFVAITETALKNGELPKRDSGKQN